VRGWPVSHDRNTAETQNRWSRQCYSNLIYCIILGIFRIQVGLVLNKIVSKTGILHRLKFKMVGLVSK
jgi:hypothetical protein